MATYETFNARRDVTTVGDLVRLLSAVPPETPFFDRVTAVARVVREDQPTHQETCHQSVAHSFYLDLWPTHSETTFQIRLSVIDYLPPLHDTDDDMRGAADCSGDLTEARAKAEAQLKEWVGSDIEHLNLVSVEFTDFSSDDLPSADGIFLVTVRGRGDIIAKVDRVCEDEEE